MTDPAMQPDEDEADNEESRPEEKFGLSFWLVLVLIGVLALLVIFVNVPGIRTATGLEITKVNWSLESYAGETGAMVPALPGVPVTARFDRDGLLKGYSGCNWYSASYTMHETALNVSQLFNTEIYCPGPGIVGQEQVYLSDLPRAASVRIGPDRLRIFDKYGKPLLEYRPLSP